MAPASALSVIPVRNVPLRDQTNDAEPLARSVKVLLVKPYQLTQTVNESPPLGLLCLSASLKAAFGNAVSVTLLDMKLYRQKPEAILDEPALREADVIGISALNCEAAAAREIARLAKSAQPSIVTVLGGPHAHKRGEEILQNSAFDWVIQGPGDRVFPKAIRRLINGHPLGDDIAGLSYRRADGTLHLTDAQDFIEDLDALPLPDWQHIDFDLYSKRMTMMAVQKGRRYALLFTSRGCPYLCNYCHDIFSKRFKFQSAERVLKEIEFLHETYGITEFQIVDDIFNLHKPRVKQIMQEVHRRWPGKLYFCFPNGVRADILDDDVLADLRLGGTYAMAIAIETATPRLQEMIEKHLNIEKAHRAIEKANALGIMVTGFFMLGFPTETRQELEDTVNFALSSKLTIANFFSVIPQPGTPLYPLAQQEDAKALVEATLADEEGQLTYRGGLGSAVWYERAYGFPLGEFANRAHLKFYASPSRLWRILTRIPPRSLWRAGLHFIRMQVIILMSGKAPREIQATPES